MPLTEQQPDITDLAIVGGGPVGLFATFYAGLRGMSARLLEALPFVGGQVAALYPEKRIYDVGGFPAVRGAELVERLTEQARFGAPRVHLGEPVTNLERSGEHVVLTTPVSTYRARAVLLAVGVGRFAPKSLGVPEVDRWAGRGLGHTVADPSRFRGQPVLVVGGGDSALDWATELAEGGAAVTLVHRRDEFRAVESALGRAEAAGVVIRRSAVVEAVLGADAPEAARIRNLKDGSTMEVPCRHVVLALGFSADRSLLRTWGLPLEGRGLVVSPDTMAVAPWIYAAGDAVAYPGKLKLIATGFAEAALAVSAARQALEPGAHLQGGHSSDLGARPA